MRGALFLSIHTTYIAVCAIQRTLPLGTTLHDTMNMRTRRMAGARGEEIEGRAGVHAHAHAYQKKKMHRKTRCFFNYVQQSCVCVCVHTWASLLALVVQFQGDCPPNGGHGDHRSPARGTQPVTATATCGGQRIRAVEVEGVRGTCSGVQAQRSKGEGKRDEMPGEGCAEQRPSTSTTPLLPSAALCESSGNACARYSPSLQKR